MNVKESSVSSRVTNILDNYDLVHQNYTRGIDISQCTLGGAHHFSVWEFSGYEPYQIFYDHFIGDQNCIHMIVYNLNQSLKECFDECVYWVEFLRARIRISGANLASAESSTNDQQDSSSTKSLKNGQVSLLFIGTHADLDKSCIKKEDGQFSSDKANELQLRLIEFYANDYIFDLSEQHFALDARAAWVTDIKLLTNRLIKIRQSLCERLPRCTMFLNRTLFHLQNFRKTNFASSVPQPMTASYHSTLVSFIYLRCEKL